MVLFEGPALRRRALMSLQQGDAGAWWPYLPMTLSMASKWERFDPMALAWPRGSGRIPFQAGDDAVIGFGAVVLGAPAAHDVGQLVLHLDAALGEPFPHLARDTRQIHQPVVVLFPRHPEPRREVGPQGSVEDPAMLRC